jgi:hypothetical protein
MYTFPCHEMKIVLEGEFDITDDTGHRVHAVSGDVFYFPKGSRVTLQTNTYGLAFYVSVYVNKFISVLKKIHSNAHISDWPKALWTLTESKEGPCTFFGPLGKEGTEIEAVARII